MTKTRNLPKDKEAELYQAAKRVSDFAYCPYSNFSVGAAVLTADGKIFAAPNIENASYSVTICAERNAAAQAVALGNRSIVALALYTRTPTPSTPCGACRQFLSEFNPEMEILCIADGEEVLRFILKELLPKAFTISPHPGLSSLVDP
jgi:cytidine deaminase